MIGGVACAAVLAAYAWWAALGLAGAWLATHWLLRESAVWRDRNTDDVRGAQRDADYAFRLAVDPSPAKELRLFGLADWTIDRFVARRTRLHALQYEATRLREKPLLWSVLLVAGANIIVFWSLAVAAGRGDLTLARAVIFAQSAVGVSMIAFGGLNWALDGSAAPVVAVLRLGAAMARAGALPVGHTRVTGMPAREIRFRDVTFAYRAARRFSITSISRFPPARRSPSSARTARARRRSRSCSAAFTTRRLAPSRSMASISERSRSNRGASVSRPCSRTSSASSCRCATTSRLPARPTTRSGGARRGWRGRSGQPRYRSRARLRGGTDLSGGQWQRVALARALCAVEMGAGLVLLDEPTAQLDVRGETEIFDRMLERDAPRTTILISHRFSTVRQADRICVLEGGRVVELGTHDDSWPRTAATGRCSICRRSALARPETTRARCMSPRLTDRRAPARTRSGRFRRRCHPCGGSASWAIATSRS